MPDELNFSFNATRSTRRDQHLVNNTAVAWNQLDNVIGISIQRPVGSELPVAQTPEHSANLPQMGAESFGAFANRLNARNLAAMNASQQRRVEQQQAAARRLAEQGLLEPGDPVDPISKRAHK